MTQVARRAQKSDPSFEAFVPPNIIELFDLFKTTKPDAERKDLDLYLATVRPEVPRSSRQRWVRAYVNGKAHSETPSWHGHYRDYDSMIGDKYSALKDGRYAAARQIWKDQGEIRYANIHCIHRPRGDGALVSLAAIMVKDFKPNAMPAMSDWLDVDRFKPHAQQPHDLIMVTLRDEMMEPRKNRFVEFEELTRETVNVFKKAAPPDCVWLATWGNHERWIIKYLLDIAMMSGKEEGGLDLAEIYIERYMGVLKDLGVLWIEQDKRAWLPLTKSFWISHGTVSARFRTRPHGATCRTSLVFQLQLDIFTGRKSRG